MADNSIRNPPSGNDRSAGTMLAPIVGRSRELADLDAVIDSTRNGQSRVVLLSGEPGIGKSRLLLHAASKAHDAGLMVLHGSCYEDADLSPYTLFIEILRDLLRQAPETQRTIDRLGAREVLSTLLPELRLEQPTQSPGSFSEQEQRQHLFDTVGRLLVAVSATQPTVLAMDDLHWADEPSAFLLRHLTRALRHSSVAILCAYRDTDIVQDDPFERVLIDLTREHLARRIALRRLDGAASAGIIAGMIGTRVDRLSTTIVDSIQRESEGVPFFVEELVLHLREENLLRQSPSGRWEQESETQSLVPQSIRSVISRRLARLPAQSRDIIGLASVSGREFERDVVVEIARRRGLADEEAVELALREGVERRLLVVDGSTFRFAHEQIREVLYQSFSAIRCRQLHQLTAEVIEQSSADPGRFASRLAYHFSRGDDLCKALHYTIAAAREATRIHALVDAARLYAHALDILDVVDDPQVRLDVLLERDAALAACGNHRERANGIDEILRLSGQKVGSTRSIALIRASELALASGELDTARARAAEAVERARGLSPAELGMALCAMGEALTGRPMGEPSPIVQHPDMTRQAAAVYREAYALAVERDDLRERARIAQEIGVLDWSVIEEEGDPIDKARHWLLLALDAFRTSGDRKGEVTALIALAYRRTVETSSQTTDARESYVSFLEEIRRLRATEHRLTRTSERPRMEALALLSVELYCRTNGWYEVALRRGTQALALADEARDNRVLALSMHALSDTERLLGRTAQAIELAERGLVVINTTERFQSTLAHQREAMSQTLAASYAQLGDLGRAIEIANESVERTRLAGRPASTAEALAILAEIALLAGNRPLAERTAHDALRVASGLPGGIGWDIRAELVLARLSLDDDNPQLALGYLAAVSGKVAQRELTQISLQIAIDTVRGIVLRAVQDHSGASDALQSAHLRVKRIADRIIDPNLRKEFLTNAPLARDILKLIGEEQGFESADAGVEEASPASDMLTRREIEVIGLVASGLPNRDIADRLYISEKTVARHLTNIFTKLNVESRTQAAAWAFRQGIV